ncbi:hypothetical protein HBB16_18220 [Pseudonocardia sp. MCCB 268]|nr:hypothetical protein [Pseudonocardia cytotoxica]
MTLREGGPRSCITACTSVTDRCSPPTPSSRRAKGAGLGALGRQPGRRDRTGTRHAYRGFRHRHTVPVRAGRLMYPTHPSERTAMTDPARADPARIVPPRPACPCRPPLTNPALPRATRLAGPGAPAPPAPQGPALRRPTTVRPRDASRTGPTLPAPPTRRAPLLPDRPAEPTCRPHRTRTVRGTRTTGGSSCGGPAPRPDPPADLTRPQVPRLHDVPLRRV